MLVALGFLGFYVLNAAIVFVVVRADGDTFRASLALAVLWPRIFVMPTRGEG
jgi:hypothetical protein